MKRFLILIIAVLVGSFSLSAQSRKTVETYEHHQARVLDAVSNAYVRPLVVDLIIDTSIGDNGKIEHTWVLDRPTAEIALGRDLENIHTYGTYMTAQYYKCDVVVAATFNLVLDAAADNYKLSVAGFAGKYVNWKPAEKTDEWWMEIVKLKWVSEAEKINPVKK